MAAVTRYRAALEAISGGNGLDVHVVCRRDLTSTVQRV
jgi:hypothetical protein